MSRVFALVVFLCTAWFSWTGQADQLRVGLAQRDITPTVDGQRPVWMAGYGHNRRAKGVHDPLYCRAVVLSDGAKTIALASVDLVGLQFQDVQRIRLGLADIDYTLVASTHNHEGPDVIGIWGPSPLVRGVDAEYVDFVVKQTIACIQEAAGAMVPATAGYGTTKVKGLLRDGRLPLVYDDILRVVLLRGAAGDDGKEPAKNVGLLVQWSCHPESLGSHNTEITADFPYAAIAALEQQYECPVIWFSGAVGGLMTNPPSVRTATGSEVNDQTFEYAETYGRKMAEQTQRAVDSASPLALTPFAVSTKQIAVPLTNRLYIAARGLGVLRRDAFEWTGDMDDLSRPANSETPADRMALRTEVSYLRLGDLHIAGIPGEIYPELVYGRYQEPVDPGADFPDAGLEPSLVQTLPGNQWLILGLANDEIGYIIPKRQWDETPPYAYGRDTNQYGEVNSCGRDVAPTIMEALVRRVREAGQK